MKKEQNNISRFVKKERKLSKLTQKELALKAGVGLRFIRDLEQGNTSLFYIFRTIPCSKS